MEPGAQEERRLSFRTKKSIMFAERLRKKREEVQEELQRLQAENAELQRIAYKDALTGLDNRHSFVPLFNKEVGIAYEDGVSLSFLIFDLDKFKLFNDAYGHPAGDFLIQLAAQAIENAVRKETDVVARIDEGNKKENGHAGRMGGEEFALVLGVADKEGALIVARRVQERYSLLQEEAKKHKLLAESTLPQTMSIGIATISGFEETPVTADDLYKNADLALYEAKKERNKIVTA